jgi:hypothetical protein
MCAGQRRVLWHNMREEPVLYINGKPYVVREADQPFCNVEYTGGLAALAGDEHRCRQALTQLHQQGEPYQQESLVLEVHPSRGWKQRPVADAGLSAHCLALA